MPTYHCDMHGEDCPSSCPTVEQWEKKYESALPSVTQGQLSQDVLKKAAHELKADQHETDPLDTIDDE